MQTIEELKTENEYLKKQMRFWRNDSVYWQMRFLRAGFVFDDRTFDSFNRYLTDSSKSFDGFIDKILGLYVSLRATIKEINSYCEEQNFKVDTTAFQVINIIKNNLCEIDLKED